MTTKKVQHNRQSDIGVERELRDIVTVLNELVEKIASPSSSLASDTQSQVVQVVNVGSNLYSLVVRSKDGQVYLLPGLLQKVNAIPSQGKEHQVVVRDSSGGARWDDVSTVGAVTNVTATAPVASSGGATPNISIAVASGSTNGYLTSADWTTFNNKLDSADVPGVRKGSSALTANTPLTITYSTPLSGTVDVIVIHCYDTDNAEVEVTIDAVTVANFQATCPVNATLKWMAVADF